MSEPREILTNCGESHTRIRVQVHLRLLTRMNFQEIHLIQLDADLHLGWIHDLQKRDAGLDLITLLNCSHSAAQPDRDRKSTRLNSSHLGISYAVFCLK